MNRVTKYWWYFRYWGSMLLICFIGFVIAGAIARAVLNSAGTGTVLNEIVYTVLFGGFALLFVQKFRAAWPPTERQVRKWKEDRETRDQKILEGPSLDNYQCEGCGTVLRRREEVNSQSAYRCEYCNHKLDNQTQAKHIYEWEML